MYARMLLYPELYEALGITLNKRYVAVTYDFTKREIVLKAISKCDYEKSINDLRKVSLT